MTGILQPSATQECSSIPFFKANGFALIGHVINSSYSNPDSCLWHCKANAKCFSVNTKKITRGTYLCELNNSTKDAEPGHLVDNPGFEYREFSLDKHHFRDGRYFQRAIFPDEWYFQLGAFFKYFPASKTWIQAKAFCRNIDADLAFISDSDLNEFVFRNLLPPARKENGCKATADMIGCWLLDGSEPEVILRNGAFYGDDNGDGVTALFLDGSGSYADTPAVSLQFPAFTITCWFKVLEPAKTPGYVFADWSSPHQFSIWVHGYWKVLFFQFRNKLGRDVVALYTGISFNAWIHVAVTWDQSSRIAKIFIDGQEDASKPADNGLLSYEIMSNSHLYYQVGSKKDTGETFYGYVRNLKVFKRLLTNNDIKHEAAQKPQATQLGVWLGLNDISFEGNYVWSNGAQATFTNWLQGQPLPQSADEDCVVMIKGEQINGGKWMSLRCDVNNTFVCWRSTT